MVKEFDINAEIFLAAAAGDKGDGKGKKEKKAPEKPVIDVIPEVDKSKRPRESDVKSKRKLQFPDAEGREGGKVSSGPDRRTDQKE